MGLSEIIAQAAQVAANAVGAQTIYYGSPRQLPQSPPAVFVRWIDTETSAATYHVRNDRGMSERKGVKRVHNGMLFVLLSNSADLPQEALEQVSAADVLMDAFDANSRLTDQDCNDTCAIFRLLRVTRLTQEWEGGIYSGIEAAWEAIET
jgi:hypothetical protein